MNVVAVQKTLGIQPPESAIMDPKALTIGQSIIIRRSNGK